MRSTKSNHGNPVNQWRKPARLLIGATLAVGVPVTASAHSFCVSTSAELQDALTQSSDGGMYAGDNNFVLLQHGTFKTGMATAGGPFHYHGSGAGGSIDIYGGYDAGCSNQLLNASRSVLDGQGRSQVLNVRSTAGPVDIYFLTIQNGESSSAGAGLSVNSVAGDNAQVSIDDVIIRNSHSSGSAGGVFAASADFLDMVNSLIVGNSADAGNGAGNLLANGSAASIAGNTITQNTTSLANGTGGLRFSGNANCNCGIANNILWNNSNFGLYLATANVNVHYNDYGTLGGMPPASANGNVSVSPKFVDASGGDFHLSGASPLLGFSPEIIGSWDLEGHPHNALGSKQDLGAYYETIFVDGFE